MKTNIKKQIGALLAGSLLLTSVVPVHAAFDDVESEQINKAIEYVQEVSKDFNREGKPCISGYNDGTFQPKRAVSRVEVAKLMLTCFELPSLDKEVDSRLYPGDVVVVGDQTIEITEETTFGYRQSWRPPAPESDPRLEFDDIDLSQWYITQGVVQEAIERGYFKGSDGKFHPNRQVTLAELLTVLERVTDFEVDLGKLPAGVSQSDWYARGVAMAIDKKLISVPEDEVLAVDYALNREETVVIIYNLLLVLKPGDTVGSIDNPIATEDSAPEVVAENTPEESEITEATDQPEGETVETNSRTSPEEWAVGDVETGVASYYGDSFDGQKTASGQVLSQFSFMAAHKSLPFGSRIKVMNPETQRFIIATVVDRGPFAEGRILDLTQSAFIELAELSAGLVKVEMEVLSVPNT